MSAGIRETDYQKRQRRTKERAEHVALHGPGCELCGNVPKSRGLHEDHDHKTGLHRGWLCARCNRVMHYWMTAVWLRDAARYLEERAA